MAELKPYSFSALIHRMFRELEEKDAIFDLSAKHFFLGKNGRDYSVRMHGKRASSPFGPASGPQTQMAQNIVLSWLAGSRIVELKTVQILDELDIPRPCIDMQTIGYNVEWSQELKLEQSLHEYVKGAMLIEILKASGKLDLDPDFGDVIYDMSVGYDLKGIQSEPVQAFIQGMMDATEVVELYRNQIPKQYRQFRELNFQTQLSDSLTLSTFHGCPPDEIEKIILFLLHQFGLNCIIKLNPTLLGRDRVSHLLNEVMGFADVHVPEKAFISDTSWEQARGFVGSLGDTADKLGVGFGVKFSNTLIVDNHRDFFPQSEKEMYLSGPPLHVLAMNLVHKFRTEFGDRFPISFSAGIDRKNFPDAAALGLTPITACSDLLQTGGYSRASAYFKELNKRMDHLGVHNIGDYILKAYGNAEAALKNCGLNPDDPRWKASLAALEKGKNPRQAAGEEIYLRWVSAAKMLNTGSYVSDATQDARYSLEKNAKPPRKVGSTLELFDCLTCDKCIPVCPNDANFILEIPPEEIEIMKLVPGPDGWSPEKGAALKLEKKHQIANFADFCNECGNCDVFCPEDGGPYILKPRFFGSRESFMELTGYDGFFLERNKGEDHVLARFKGEEYKTVFHDGSVRYSGPGFSLAFSKNDPEDTVSGEAGGAVDMTHYEIMERVRTAIFDSGHVSYVSALSHYE